MEEAHKSAVILANGEFPEHEKALLTLKKAEYLVCTDGSVTGLTDYQRTHSNDTAIAVVKPSVVIGDGDSLRRDLKNLYKSIYIEYKEQDDNDLSKATKYLKSQDFTHITYLGIGGKRDDHAMANYALLMHYKKALQLEVEAYTNYGHIFACKGSKTFHTTPGIQVSIFNFGSKVLKSEGLKWPTYAFEELWQGTLNEALSDEFRIDADGYYLVYMTYDVKVTV